MRVHQDQKSNISGLFVSNIVFIYSWDTHRERQKHKQAPCREPDAGLDPGTPGSGPEPKAGAQLLSHPGALVLLLI